MPKVNELIKQADIPALTVAEAAKPSPARLTSSGASAGLRHRQPIASPTPRVRHHPPLDLKQNRH